MRFRHKITGVIIDVKSDLKGPWEKLDGGENPAAIFPAQTVETVKAEDVKKKPGRKAKK